MAGCAASRTCSRDERTLPLLPDRDIGICEVQATALTPGTVRSVARSRSRVARISGCERFSSARMKTYPVLRSSATPLGRSEAAMRNCTTKSALARIARLMATWMATSSGPVRWRRSADRIGRNSMVILSLGLELQGRSDLACAPRRQQPGHDACQHRYAEGRREHLPIHARHRGEIARLQADEGERAERQ